MAIGVKRRGSIRAPSFYILYFIFLYYLILSYFCPTIVLYYPILSYHYPAIVGGKVSLQTRSQWTVGLSVGRSQLVEISRKAVSKKKRKECIVSPKLSVKPVRVVEDSKAVGQSIYL